MSPTVLRSGPYRFHFYSQDGGEPAHVHVDRDDCSAKFWLNPVEFEYNFGIQRDRAEDHSADHRGESRDADQEVE